MSNAMLPRATVYLHRAVVNVFVLLLSAAVSVVFSNPDEKNIVLDVFSRLLVSMPLLVMLSLALEHAIPRLEDDAVQGKLPAANSISDCRYSIAFGVLLLLAWRLGLDEWVFPTAAVLFVLLSASISKVIYFHFLSDHGRA